MLFLKHFLKTLAYCEETTIIVLKQSAGKLKMKKSLFVKPSTVKQMVEPKIANENRPVGKMKLVVIILFALFVFISISAAFESPKQGPIIVYGDSRRGHETHKRIIDAFMDMKPVSVFSTGDLVTKGSSIYQWTRFKKFISRITNESEFYPVRGNHDGSFKSFVENAGVPGNISWYCVEKNSIHFIVLDSSSDLSEGSNQYKWLLTDIENIGAESKFIVVMFHHPIFTSEAGGHTEDEKEWGPILLPLLEQYSVDLVFCGHIHAYERLSYKGIYFITTGGGGAPLYSCKKRSDYSEKYILKHHFCRLTTSDDLLTVEVIDIDLVLIDTIEIQRKSKKSNLFW
jgi:predicted phosphodiesterase